MGNIDFIKTLNGVDIRTGGGVTLNGKKLIVENTPAVTFAESERQKSKNLFRVTATKKISYAGVTLSLDASTNSIKLNGTATALNEISLPSCISLDIKANTSYTISYKEISGNKSGIFGYIGFYGDYGKYDTTHMIRQFFTSPDAPQTYTFDEDLTLTSVRMWISSEQATSGLSFDDYTLQFQVEEGESATNFQEYNGEIVHNLDLENLKNKLKSEDIYSITSSDANINWGQTSGITCASQVDEVVGFSQTIDVTKYEYIDAVFQVGGFSYLTIRCQNGLYYGQGSNVFRGIGSGNAYYYTSSYDVSCVVSISSAGINYRMKQRNNEGVRTTCTSEHVRLIGLKGYLK